MLNNTIQQIRVDKEIIKQKKKIYGSNFEAIADKWTKYLNSKLGICPNGKFEIEPIDVAKMMVLFKEARYEVLKKIIEKNQNNRNYKRALEDTIVDLANYKWIGENYEEYKNL